MDQKIGIVGNSTILAEIHRLSQLRCSLTAKSTCQQPLVMRQITQCGFNLTELLIVCVIASLLLLGVSEFFIAQHKTSLWQQGISRLQENGRFASFILLRGIEEAGFQGCTNFTTYTQWLKRENTTPSFDGIKGYQAIGQHWEPALPSELPNTVVPGTDIVEVNRADDVGFDLIQADQGSRIVKINTTSPPAPNSQLIISDCEHYEFHLINDVVKLSDNLYQLQLTSNLAHSYTETAFIAPMHHTFYFIADTKRTNEQEKPVYGLYTLDHKGRSTELIDGISSMRIYYRLLSPLLANPLSSKAVTAETVSKLHQWDHVSSVEIDLLVDSVEAVPNHPGIYTFHDKIIDEKNGRFYRLWHLVITLKARCPLCSAVSS